VGWKCSNFTTALLSLNRGDINPNKSDMSLFYIVIGTLKMTEVKGYSKITSDICNQERSEAKSIAEGGGRGYTKIIK